MNWASLRNAAADDPAALNEISLVIASAQGID